jgi:sialate O-acetylesterase
MLPKEEQDVLLQLLEFTNPIAVRVEFLPKEGKSHVLSIAPTKESERFDSGWSILVRDKEVNLLYQLKFLKSMLLYDRTVYANDGGRLFNEEVSFTKEALAVLQTINGLSDLDLPENISDIGIGKLGSLNELEVLTSNNRSRYNLRGAFIGKLSSKSELRILSLANAPVEIKYLNKLRELSNFMYIVVPSNTAPFKQMKLYKSRIPDYIEECESKGYRTIAKTERENPSKHQEEMKALEEREAAETAKEMRLAHHRELGFRAANIFTSGMVLQREMPVPVWGTARPGDEITVSFAGQKKIAKANEKGNWFLKLDPLAASMEGRVLTIESGKKKEELKDVLVGEVWLTSGRREMGVSCTRIAREKTSLFSVNKNKIRHFKPVLAWKAAPTAKTEVLEEQWKTCTAENLSNNRTSFSGISALFAEELQKKLNVPVGIIDISTEDVSNIESWMPKETFLQTPFLAEYARPTSQLDQLTPDSPASLFNGTLFPIVPYAIRGVIRASWRNEYLGPEIENRTNGKAANFISEFTALFQGWRSAWKQKVFPFYYTPVFPRIGSVENASRFLEIWEQQATFLSYPNTGMVLRNDLKAGTYLMPDTRKVLASRFARLALSRTYGFKYPDDSGPLFKSAAISEDGKKIVAEFDHANSGLATRDGKPPSHFEAAGEDGKFFPAAAKITSKDTVEVTCGEIKGKLVRVRFAWDVKAAPNLINNEKLPAGAFRWPIPTRPDEPDLPVHLKPEIDKTILPLPAQEKESR